MFNLVETDDENILWARLRFQRDKELALCDWTQLADSTADKTAWATYRQALRDLPAQNADPKLIVFPTRPE
jgi:hypothetical protein